LESRRLLTDLVWCYKILFGIVEMSATEEFFYVQLSCFFSTVFLHFTEQMMTTMMMI